MTLRIETAAPLAVGASAIALAALSRRAAAAPVSPALLTMPTVLVTPDALRNIGATGTRPQYYAAELTRWLNHFEITSPNRVCHFLGQCFHESGAMALMREGPSRFASSRSTYAGRGFTQLTGQSNYEAYRTYLRTHGDVPYADVVARPNLVETLPYAIHVAAWYWDKENANRYGDLPVTYANVRTITARILRPALAAYHTDRRFAYAQAAEAQIALGAITFGMSPAPNEPGSAANPVSSIIKGGTRTVKEGGIAKPASTLGLVGADGQIASKGLIALGVVGALAFMPTLRG